MKLHSLLLLITLLLTACTTPQATPRKPYAHSMMSGDYPVNLSTVDYITIEPTTIETGSRKQFTLGITPCPEEIMPGFGSTDRLYADTLWSISPEDENISLNPKTGEIILFRQVKHNGKYTIKAQIKGRSEPVESNLTVYSKTANPLIGYWNEQATGDDTINELYFDANGYFSVTLMPFESYKDYGGTYSIDPEKRILSLTITGGNHKPDDAKLDNIAYHFTKEGHLVLENAYFGTLRKGFEKKNSYIFLAR